MTHELHLQSQKEISPQIAGLNIAEAGEQSVVSSLGILTSLEQAGIPIDDKEGIATSLDTLRSEFGIEDRFMEDPKSAIVMSAIADRYNRVQKDKTMESGVTLKELDYIADLTMSVAGKHSKFKDQHKAGISESSLSDEHTKKVYEKFTQLEVTKDMDTFIRGPRFDELRKRLGVTDETPYTVKVLSIDSSEGSQAYGMVPSIDYSGEHTSAEFNAKVEEGQYRKDYVKGLEKNGDAFNEALGREGAFAPAWVTSFDDGTQYLCLALPTAEKVMYTDQERATYYDASKRDADVAIIEHEYTHTQKQLIFGGNIGPGIALEEMRAEHFSGNKQGYTDIKKFFNGVAMLTGYTPTRSFEISGNSYDESAFLGDVARNLGLDGLLECLTAIPKNYAEDEEASNYVKAIVTHNGGSLSEHFKSMYEHTKAKLGEKTVQTNIDLFIDKMRGSIKGNEYITVESWLHYGGITSLAQIGMESFRGRYPEESDNYDYDK